jgi:glycosyltransferase involved in cell wall biosynthesis
MGGVLIEFSRQVQTIHLMKAVHHKAFHHLAAALVPADAVSNCAIMMHEMVQDLGYRSFLYAPLRAGDYAKSARRLSDLESEIRSGDVVVYHHSTGSDAAELFTGRSNVRRLLVYHNVTPPLLLDPNGEAFAANARGLAQLPSLVQSADLSIAFSEFSARDLRQAGGSSAIKVVALPLSDAWCDSLQLVATKRDAQRRQNDSAVRLLHVGRVVPSKRLEIAIRAAEWIARDGGNLPVSLTLVGDTNAAPEYVEQLVAYAGDHPSITLKVRGSLSRDALAEEFAAADIYICPSAHEGFCVPLVECMFAELPVIAAACGAIPETLAGSGIVLPDACAEQFAEAARRLLLDAALREKLREKQREVRGRYTMQSFKQGWVRIIAGLLEQETA